MGTFFCLVKEGKGRFIPAADIAKVTLAELPPHPRDAELGAPLELSRPRHERRGEEGVSSAVSLIFCVILFYFILFCFTLRAIGTQAHVYNVSFRFTACHLSHLKQHFILLFLFCFIFFLKFPQGNP